MNRTERTAANAVTEIVAVVVQSLLGLVVTRTLIMTVGSDYSGINSTSGQLLTFLSLIEGGFTLAALVKLYEPYGRGDWESINRYLSLSAGTFRRMGVLYLLTGTATVCIYAPFVKTSAPISVTASIMILSVLPSAFSVYWVSRFRLLYQVSQSEYVVYIIQIATNIPMYVTEIIILKTTSNIIYARLCVAVFQILSGLLLGSVAMRKFRKADFSRDPGGVEITGTKDVFVSRLCSIVHSASPFLFISSFIGTAYTSVYAVYSSVFTVIGSVMNALLIAPRNALGQMFSSDERERIETVYNEYELISTAVMAVLYSVTFALIIPFVRLYTGSATDINYVDVPLALLFVLNEVCYVIHIPAGTCLEVSGSFRVIRRIHSAAAALIIVLSLAGALFGGLYGILGAKLLTSIFLMTAEILSVRGNVLKSRFSTFFRINMPSIVTGNVLAAAEYFIVSGSVTGVFLFVMYGTALVLVNTLLIAFVNALVNRSYFLSALRRIRSILPSGK